MPYTNFRFTVSGLRDGVTDSAAYKRLKCAQKFADKLKESEVYDTLTKTYVYGSSKFVKRMLVLQSVSS